jgi:hypothetical protein
MRFTVLLKGLFSFHSLIEKRMKKNETFKYIHVTLFRVMDEVVPSLCAEMLKRVCLLRPIRKC